MNKEKSEYSDWRSINWNKVEKTVVKLQERIYQAKRNGNQKLVKCLQRLLVKSRSAKLLAVRKVTQDNRGKRTAGVDGKKALTPKERLKLAEDLKFSHRSRPLRRIYIPKSNSEKRPLSIPTMYDRAAQTLMFLALEPEWEAVFEPNSYGFRRGRSCHDAIQAIFNSINKKQKWVLDADIAKCFDRINHEHLLDKLGDCLVPFRRQIKAWLKSGYMEAGQKDEIFPTDEGTPQGGVISPLLANIALHGLENHIMEWVKTWKGRKADNLKATSIIRYADDFVFIHENKAKVEEAKVIISEFLQPIGLELKPSKTRIVHTIEGFDFLGFNIRHYLTGKHQSGKSHKGYITLIKPSKEKIKKHYDKLAKTIQNGKALSQDALIGLLNPQITGWCRYNSHVVSKKTFSKLDYLTYGALKRWTKRRHPNKRAKWRKEKYYRQVVTSKMREGIKISSVNNWIFNSPKGGVLKRHSETPIVRHVKVEGERSPYDGDYIYWGKRLAKSSILTTRQQNLLKRQKGICPICKSQFRTGDLLEVDHILPKCFGGKDSYENLQLLHAHCHDKKTRADGSQKSRVRNNPNGTHDLSQIIEERSEVKVSCCVLKTSVGGDSDA